MAINAKADENIPTFGYIAVTFPRDPVQVNQFVEHMVLGQVLEPLVAADKLGNTIPGIAQSWIFAEGGLSIQFKLKNGSVFSNGKPVEAADVRATLLRHANTASQSSNFLKTIRDIEVMDTLNLVIHLKEKNVSILKALSRDQLGIMPRDWHFDPKSNEPIIGTGAYRLIRQGSAWHLKKNDRSQAAQSLSVPEWKLAFYKDEAWQLPEGPLADFAPVSTTSELVAMKSHADFLKRGFVVKPRLSFVQTSAWWYPHGPHFDSSAHRKSVMSALHEVMAACLPRLGNERATGVIPFGVAGFLPQLPALPKVDARPAAKVKIAALGSIFNELLDCEEEKKIFAAHHLQMEKVTFTMASVAHLKDEKPDVVMASWAGGFNDPDGFLPILNSFLSTDFVAYLNELAPLYQLARNEQNWTQRAERFREFNKALIENFVMVPGWRVPMYSVTSKRINEEETDLRYTPRLINVQKK